MSTTPIQALDTIDLAATPAAVWRVLVDAPNYVAWWPRSLGLRVLEPGQGGLGCVLEIKPSGGRPFRVRVEEIREPDRILLRYHGGFVEGRGEWRVEPVGSLTRVSYQLDAQAHGRLVSWIGRWFELGKIHSRSMRGVLQNLDAEVRRRAG